MRPEIVREVWARAAGICSYPGCQEILYLDRALLKSRAFGEVAHNVAALPGGERGDPNRSRALCQDPENLILLCPTHHTIVDKPGAALDYPDALLAEWKGRHEACVRSAGLLCSGTLAHALIVRGPIGGQPLAFNPQSIPFAMLKDGLVPDQPPTVVEIDASAHPPKSIAYWENAIAQVRARIKTIQSAWRQDARPIALFAVADMPTLMALGYALGHAAQVHVFQFDPEPRGGDWRFPDYDAPAPNYHVPDLGALHGSIALVFSLSGVIERARVTAALPPGPSTIIEITTENPTTNLVRSPAAITEFGRRLRALVAGLEQRLPKSTPIHVFPAMPASLAVTFGRYLKPKVSFAFTIYDAEGQGAPFAPAVVLPYLDQGAKSD